MKRFLTTAFALTLFSTSGVFGGSFSKNNNLGNFLTINGKPLNSYEWNVQGESNSKPNKPNNTVKPNNCPTPNKPETTTVVTTEKPNNPIETTTTNTTEKPTETTTQSINKPESQNSDSLSFEKEVLRLVNSERTKAGLSPLEMDSQVANVARIKSEDMRDKNYFSHTSPTYGSPFDMLKKFNVTYRSAGENIAKGQKTPEAVVTAWMNSEGHRKNILGNFTHIGVGYAKGGSKTYWTQMFITK